MLLGGLLFYAMPFFERHPSNHYVLQKYSTGLYPSHVTEAAALLDMEPIHGKNHPQHQCHLSPGNGIVPFGGHSNSSNSSSKAEPGVRVQLQCLVTHKERERHDERTGGDHPTGL